MRVNPRDHWGAGIWRAKGYPEQAIPGIRLTITCCRDSVLALEPVESLRFLATRLFATTSPILQEKSNDGLLGAKETIMRWLREKRDTGKEQRRI